MKRTWLSLAVGVFLGFLCLVGTGLAVYIFAPERSGPSVVSPQVTVLSAPSLAPTAIPTATIPPEMLATIANLPPDPGTAIQVGMSIHISGTGGDGLRVREAPGVNSAPLFLAAENEEFLVVSGPETSDNLNWWFIKAPYDEKRQGWAAANYLAPNPIP